VSLLLLLAALVDAQVARLGADDYATRERATERLSNPLAALLVPAANDDAEVNHRLRRIRARGLRHLRLLDPLHVEGVMYRDDFPRWVALYLVTGRTQLDPADTFADIHRDPAKADAVFRVWPAERENFLRGNFIPGEYDRWLEFCDYHRLRAPMPRESPGGP
jgi:hypothetical protein